MQKQQQQKYKQMKLKNPPKVDRNGSHDFVEWQQKQQELFTEMNGVPGKAVVQQGPQHQMRGPQQQMKGSQQQMKGPQQQMKGPQQQMNGVADLDQQRMMRLPAESTSHQAEVEELERRLAKQRPKANEPPPPPTTIITKVLLLRPCLLASANASIPTSICLSLCACVCATPISLLT
jgi:hypothetical protein